MKKWEKVKIVLESTDRLTRIEALFELMETERKEAVEIYKKQGIKQEERNVT